jgi:hypothetical protein
MRRTRMTDKRILRFFMELSLDYYGIFLNKNYNPGNGNSGMYCQTGDNESELGRFEWV